jgi:hypothetical protein
MEPGISMIAPFLVAKASCGTASGGGIVHLHVETAMAHPLTLD